MNQFGKHVQINTASGVYKVDGREIENLYKLNLEFKGGNPPSVHMEGILDGADVVLTGYIYPHELERPICCGEVMGTFMGSYRIKCPGCGRLWDSRQRIQTINADE